MSEKDPAGYRETGADSTAGSDSLAYIDFPPGEAGEALIPAIIGLCSRDLSEPYSIFTYRYFLEQWPVSPQTADRNRLGVPPMLSPRPDHRTAGPDSAFWRWTATRWRRA